MKTEDWKHNPRGHQTYICKGSDCGGVGTIPELKECESNLTRFSVSWN
jgi:hypothetical protein